MFWKYAPFGIICFSDIILWHPDIPTDGLIVLLEGINSNRGRRFPRVLASIPVLYISYSNELKWKNMEHFSGNKSITVWWETYTWRWWHWYSSSLQTFSEVFHSSFTKPCKLSVENTFLFRRSVQLSQIEAFTEQHSSLFFIHFSPLQLKLSTNRSFGHYPNLILTFFTALYVIKMQQNLLKWVSDKRMGLLKDAAQQVSHSLGILSQSALLNNLTFILNSLLGSVLTVGYDINCKRHLIFPGAAPVM